MVDPLAFPSLAFFSAFVPFALEETVVVEEVGEDVGEEVDEKLVGSTVEPVAFPSLAFFAVFGAVVEEVHDGLVVDAAEVDDWVGAVVDAVIRDALEPTSLDTDKGGPTGAGVGLRLLSPNETDELSGWFVASLNTGKGGPMGRGVGLIPDESLSGRFVAL